MNWTNYAGNRTGIESLYNSSTYLKQRYTYAYDSSYEWTSVFTSTLNQVRNNFRSSYTYGLYDTKVTGTIIPIGVSVDFAETVCANSVEIYAFRDNTTPSHYLVNAFGENESETLFCAHSAVLSDGTSALTINSDKSNDTINVLTLTTAQNTLNNSYGNDYIVQPLCAFDEKTPFYLISGNASLAAFTTVAIGDMVFMSIGNGICVEMNA